MIGTGDEGTEQQSGSFLQLRYPSFLSPIAPMLSLRVKLTFYYLATLSAVLLFFGIAIYAYLSHSLVLTIDETLAYQLRKIEHHLVVSSGAELPDQKSDINEDSQLIQISPQFTQIIDENGRIADEMVSTRHDDLPIDMEKLRALEVGRDYFDSVLLKTGEELRVATRRVKDHAGSGGYYIRLGQSLESLRVARRRLLLILGVAIPVVLLLGSYGGLMLANQALRPVDRITRVAEQISTG